MPDIENVCTRKHSAVEATEQEIGSIADRNSHLIESDEFDQLIELKKKREKQELKIEKFKLKYKNSNKLATNLKSFNLFNELQIQKRKIYLATS